MARLTNSTLYERLKNRHFIPAHATEVGVYRPETSNIYKYILDNVRCTLVEPDPSSIELIKECFSNRNNITLHQVAVSDKNGSIDLVQRGASTFAANIPQTPSMINDAYTIADDDRFTVDCVTFDVIDDKSIDLLSIDIEGGEWFVLKHMRSRPAIISIETHGAAYINPFLDEIVKWMSQNNYCLWYRDKADSVYVNRNTFTPDLRERLASRAYGVYLFSRRVIKLTKLKLRKLFGINKRQKSST